MIKVKKEADPGYYQFDKDGLCKNAALFFSYHGSNINVQLLTCRNSMGFDAGYNIGFISGRVYEKPPVKHKAYQQIDEAVVDTVLEELIPLIESEEENGPITGIEKDIKFLKDYATAMRKVTNIFNQKDSTMAKIKDAPAPPAEETKVENIKLGQIVASAMNPRKSFTKQTIEELAESMKPPIGLMQPITLRPRAAGIGYEIVAGERRWRAATILKWETIPCIIRNISDDDMLEFQILENLQREDVSPMDEANAFHTLLKKESIDWLASKIHKTKKYITDRLKLNELSEEAQDYVREGVLPLGHAVVISKLSFADQQLCLDKCIDSGFGENTDDDYCKMPLEELKDFISDDIMLDFEKINFDPDDATLYPEAGACKTCTKRTCNSNLLFQDITKDDKCTDKGCFHQKIELHIARNKEKAKEEFGKVLSGEKAHNSGEIKVQGVDVKYSTTPTKNTIPVVLTKADRWNKNELGTTVYVDSKILENKKVQKVTQKEERKSNGGNNTQVEENKKIREVLWPRIEMIVNGGITINGKVMESFMIEVFQDTDDDVFLAFCAVLGLSPKIQDVEEYIKAQKFLMPSEKEKLIRKVFEIENYKSLGNRIQLLELLKSAEDPEPAWKETVKQNLFTISKKITPIKPSTVKGAISSLLKTPAKKAAPKKAAKKK